MSINRWMDKDVVPINNGISLIHKEEWKPFAATGIIIAIIILHEVGQRQVWYHICGIWKNDTTELIYRTEIKLDLENKHMVTERESWGWRDKLEGWD